MKEIILHYLWLHKQFDVTQLFTTKNEKIEIFNFGQYLQKSGPDFFNAQLIIDNQKWAGNIEIHVNSSDWYLHHHELDKEFDNVILHVVWNHDTEVYRKNKTEIPVLELKKYISKETLYKINTLLEKKSWINCENSLDAVSQFTWLTWKESLFFERLEEKATYIQEIFDNLNQDWEATCFAVLAKNFGLNINGETFLNLASTIPFSIIRKESHTKENLEALLFGVGGFLSDEFQDEYPKKLQTIWQYQKVKYNITENKELNFQFYKLRPNNFPTIRLAQLAALYHKTQNVFERLINIKTLSDADELFKVEVSDYWKNHYNFDRKTSKKITGISIKFVELILINSVVPLQFVFNQYKGNDAFEDIIQLSNQVKSERNSIVERFQELKVNSESAFDSQALLQLKKQYCEKQACLKCRIGIEILKKNHTFEV